MTLYLDTSALVKLFVDEQGTGRVEAWVEDAEQVMTALITFAEVKATLGRLQRLGRLSLAAQREASRRFEEQWSNFGIVAIDEPLVRQAGLFAERYDLRGYDAVQLAAAVRARARDGRLTFASFDDRLNRAAVREKLALPPEPDLVADRPRFVVRRRRAG